jgi:hypothetical protein
MVADGFQIDVTLRFFDIQPEPALTDAIEVGVEETQPTRAH